MKISRLNIFLMSKYYLLGLIWDCSFLLVYFLNPLCVKNCLSNIPAYLGAKSNMFDLLPGTVIPLKPMEMVNMITAASALQPMYPAMTTVMAGTWRVLEHVKKMIVFINFKSWIFYLCFTTTHQMSKRGIYFPHCDCSKQIFCYDDICNPSSKEC